MGLDTVELILRAEETFGIELPDYECSLIITVGDLYRLVLDKLSLLYLPASLIEDPQSEFTGRDRSGNQFPALADWNTPDVWATLKGLICDQLQVDESQIQESASFSNDLRCD
jgi:acyl carrier protein